MILLIVDCMNTMEAIERGEIENDELMPIVTKYTKLKDCRVISS